MSRPRFRFVSVLAVACASGALAADEKKVTYEDDVLPIFRDNCLKCHNPDKLKGDLDLTSFSSALKGGGGGVDLNAGDPDGSQLFRSVTHSDDPTMPPNAKLTDRDIAVIRQWIAGGLLQGANSKAIAASKPAIDLSLKKASVGRPEGPPVMPGNLALEPIELGERGSALSAIASSPWAPVVALSGTKQIVFYNTSDLDFIGVLPFPEGLVCDLKFSRNGKLLLAGGGHGGKSGGVAVWDVATGERVITVGDQFDSVLAADISSDQQWIALGGPDRVLKIYRTKTGALEHRIKKHTEWVTAVEFSPDGKYLASGDRNGGLVIWEAESGEEMFNLPGHKAAVTAISWRDDSAMFVSSSEDGTLKLWKASDGTALRSINAHGGGALSASFAHDGRIVSCGRDNKVIVWDTSGKNLQALAFSGDLPNRATFTEDGKQVVGSDWQGRVYVWDVKTGKPIGQLDSNPPSLAERVNQINQHAAALQLDLDKAAKTQSGLETEAKNAAAAVEKSKRALADARSALANKEAEGKKLAAQLKAPGADAALKKQEADTHAAIKTLQAQIAGLEKSSASAAKQVTEANKRRETGKAALAELEHKLAAAKTSLVKWTTTLQNAKPKPGDRRVSMQ